LLCGKNELELELLLKEKMSTYAQTNIQLYNQLQGMGYSQGDLILVRNAYDLSTQLYSGRFQAQGKDFISHLVGTASILCTLAQPPEMVATGLIHSVYNTGDFGDGKWGMTKRRQSFVRQRVGSEVETFVSRFHSFKWGEESLLHIYESLPIMNQLDRCVVLLYLADNIEHSLDFGYCYYDVKAQRFYAPPNWDLLITIAIGLGFPAFAKALDLVHTKNAGGDIPEEFHGYHGRGFTIPKSCRKRMRLVWQERWVQAFWYLRWLLASGFRPLRHSIRGVKKLIWDRGHPSNEILDKHTDGKTD